VSLSDAWCPFFLPFFPSLSRNDFSFLLVILDFVFYSLSLYAVFGLWSVW
jgi:hypothetical protein